MSDFNRLGNMWMADVLKLSTPYLVFFSRQLPMQSKPGWKKKHIAMDLN